VCAYDLKYGHLTADGDTGEENTEEAQRRAEAFTAAEEPVFIIRGKDLLAVPTIAQYQRLASEAALDPKFVTSLNEVISTVAEFQANNAEIVRLPN
jgi:hypothetical protein